jgi:ribosomal-protein-alanine N-acetyltransferase
MTPRLFDPANDDAALLAMLHESSFPAPWTKTAIRDLLAGPGVFAWLSKEGFVLARAAGGEAEILTLAVAPSARGQGLGCALLRSAAVHAASLGATRVFLEVGTDNPAALALYAGLGFERVGQRKGYYFAPGGEGRDAWVLSAPLPLPAKFA